MKKGIFSVMVILVSTMSFGQMTNTEIMQTILMSKELNQKVGVFNPDKIKPGQQLTFCFKDGTEKTIMVEAGDNQWNIVGKKLSTIIKEHGEIIPPKVSKTVTPKPVVPPTIKDPFPWWTVIGIMLILILLFLLFRYLGKATKETKKKEYVDPTKAGQPFVSGGVKPENAEKHFHDLTARNTEPSNIVIRDVRPMFISTKDGLPQIVCFADNTSKELLFRNVPGFAGLVSRDKGKTFKEEYYFERCGNPVYRKQSFLAGDGLIISPSPINFGNGEVIQTETVKEKPEVNESVTKKPTPENSDLLEVALEHSLLLERLIEKNQTIHRVTTKFMINGEGFVETIFETKNAPTEKKEEGK